MDPIAVSLLFLEENNEKRSIGFSVDDTIVSFGAKPLEEIQRIIDSIITRLMNCISGTVDNSSVDYSVMNGQVFHLPKWFMTIRGHDLVDYYKATFPFLNKYRSEADLYRKIVNLSYSNYPGIIPTDLIDSLIELQLT